MVPDAGLLAKLLCRCGSRDVVAIAPGSPTEISPASDIMTRRGEPVTGRCLACWPVQRLEEPKARRRR